MTDLDLDTLVLAYGAHKTRGATAYTAYTAYTAAYTAAWAAAWAALAPTVNELQASAIDLYSRMARLGRNPR